jgi:DNA-binding response OmpR family regulator
LASAPSFIAVIGHGPDLEREAGAAGILRNLGAQVRTLDLWDDPADLFREGDDDEMRPRAILVEAADRPDLASAALRSLKRQVGFEGVGSIIALTTAQVARLDPSSGFDDFVLMPFVPAELYARIRALEWRRSEFATEERLKIGEIVVDKAAREVVAQGRPVFLTAKEFALLAFLCERRGKALSREQLLAKVWGTRYEGGPRTVDIHVRRLRAKLGDDFPLETLRGAGYKLRAPTDGEAEPPRKRR